MNSTPPLSISSSGVNSSSRSAAPLRLSTRRSAASPSVIQDAARLAQRRTRRTNLSNDPTSFASAVYRGGAGGAPDFQRMPGAGPFRGSQAVSPVAWLRPGILGGSTLGRLDPRRLDARGLRWTTGSFLVGRCGLELAAGWLLPGSLSSISSEGVSSTVGS